MKILSKNSFEYLLEHSISLGIELPRIYEQCAIKAFEKIKKYDLDFHKKRYIFLLNSEFTSCIGSIIAREMHFLKIPLSIMLFNDSPISELLETELSVLKKLGVDILEFNPANNFLNSLNPDVDVLIDCMFGLDLVGEAPAFFKSTIQFLSDFSGKKIALEVPAGLESNTGLSWDETYEASLTITFGSPKLGNLIQDGLDYCPTIENISLPLDFSILKDSPFPLVNLVDYDLISTLYKKRKRNSHKGTYGKTIVWGGSLGMEGAPLMTSLSAFKSGSGYTELHCFSDILPSLVGKFPEIMVKEIDEDEILGYFSLVVGPGLGNLDALKKVLLERVLLEHPGPLVVDADGITNGIEFLKKKARDNRVLTPHPGELAKILETSLRDIAENPIKHGIAAQKMLGGILVMKGSSTFIFTPDSVYLYPGGASALSKGGSGDILAGIIGSFLAQGYSPSNASILGVYLHGEGAKHMSESHSPHFISPFDILNGIDFILKELEDIL